VKKKQIRNLVVIILLTLWSAWVGYRMKIEDDYTRVMDAKTDAYFDSIEKTNSTPQNFSNY